MKTMPMVWGLRMRHRLARGATHLTLIVFGVVFLAPLVWMVSTSLKPDTQLIAFPPQWIPRPAIWRNYYDAWVPNNFSVYLKNTLTITILTVVGQTISASMAAYGFARLRFPGRDVLFGVVLGTMMMPGVVTLVPRYLLFLRLGWVDTFLPLIIPYFFGGSYLYIFLLRQFFRSIPSDLSDAAKIDGCSEFGIFRRIVLPLSKPAMTTVLIFSFVGSWNDFTEPLIYLNTESKRTLTLALRDFIVVSQHLTQYQYLMAVSVITILPIIVLFFFGQSYFIRGVTMTGIKG